MDLSNELYYQYAEDVLNGKIVAGELIKLACKRFMYDLENLEFEFRKEKVVKFIKFSNIIKHFKGKSAGKPFKLEPWQQFIVANILGFYYRGTTTRRFTNAVICISRKQGKTALAALISLWFLLFDGEQSPEIDIAANDFNQATVAFEFISQFCKQLDPKQKNLKIFRSSIVSPLNIGKLNVFSGDTKTKDGYNASMAILDEMGAARDSKMYDIIRSSMGQRENPLLLVISTVGFDLMGPFYKMYQTGTEILQGVKSDESSFYMIFSLDEKDDWTDETVWEKIAPNLDVTVDKKYLREQVVYARNNTSAEVGILTKNFNKWCQSSEVWISDYYINNVSQSINLSDFSECETYIGVDLAAVSDITAVSYLMVREDDEKLYFKTDYYLPETMLTESPNRELYKHWHRTKQLKITPGNVTDYDYITNDIMNNYNNLTIKKIGYDSWNSTQWAISATEQGLPLEPYSQSIGNFNKPTRELERLIKSKKIVIDNNEITRWMFRNVALKSDHNGNVKPNKGAGKDKKIDGVISSIEALGIYLDTPRYQNKIFVI